MTSNGRRPKAKICIQLRAAVVDQGDDMVVDQGDRGLDYLSQTASRVQLNPEIYWRCVTRL